MPLYELILLTRCGDAKQTAGLFKNLAELIYNQGGNVREMQILGDRILPKTLQANDKNRHIVGRYMQILFDGNLTIKKSVETTAKGSYDTIRVRTNKIKDFFNDAHLFKKAAKQQSPIIDEDLKNREFVKELMEILQTKK